MARYHFKTIWNFHTPVEKVWKEINSMDTWPEWWKYVESVKLIKAGDLNDIKSVRQITWRTALPYKLKFDCELIDLELYKCIKGNVYGELSGTGTWLFAHKNNITTVQYIWDVETTKWWMNILEPVARPVFKWNHDKVMDAGFDGLKKRLLQHPQF